MDPLSTAASLTNSYRAADMASSYSLAVTDMMMDDTQELALQELEKMLPPSPYTFDIYA